MPYTKKTWVDRQSEHPTRRTLTPTGTENEYDVARAEGLIMEDGDAFDAANMNDLEKRVAAGIGGTAPQYTATYTLDGWAAASETDAANGWAYTQTVALAAVDTDAPAVTADSRFLVPPEFEKTGVPATDERLGDALDVINAGHTTCGDGTVTTLVQEMPEAEIEIIWTMRV